MENLTIFVPSKKRALSSKTIQNLNSEGLEFYLFIEKEELKDYETLSKNTILLPESNMGITYVRNYMKTYAKNNGFKNYWQLDDDISNVYQNEDSRMVKTSFKIALENSQKVFLENNIALGSLEYRQFAWSQKKLLTKNSFCDSIVFTDLTKIPFLKYDFFVEGKEDRDMAMQVIKNGFNTARINLYGFSAPENGSNAGGLKEIFYDLDKEQNCCKNMVEKWGETICKHIIKQNGDKSRNDVKIDWKQINSNQTSLF